MEVLNQINIYLGLPFVALIWLYQRTLSPDHGLFKARFPYGYCKYHPTCSEYARLVLRRQGVIGFPKIIKRILKCNPLSLGGIDQP